MSILKLLNELDKRGHEIGAYFGNKHIMEISAKSKRNPAWVKIAIDEETAQKLMRQSCSIEKGTTILCLLDLPLDATNEIIKEQSEEMIACPTVN